MDNMNMTSLPWSLGDAEYKKKQEAVKKAIADAAKKTDSKVLQSMVKEDKAEGDEKTKMRCQMAEQIFHESMDMYEEGDMTFVEMVDDLSKALKAIE